MFTCSKCGNSVSELAKCTARWCPACLRAYQRIYHQKRRAQKATDPYCERQKEAQVKHYAKNVEYYRERSRRQFHENKEQKLAYMAERYKANWRIRLCRCATTTMNESLRAGRPAPRWFRYFPFSFPQLIAHIETSFRPGMSWENRSKWHIDHIKPLSAFEFAESRDPVWDEMWSLSNMQLLWPSENASKGHRSSAPKYVKYV